MSKPSKKKIEKLIRDGKVLVAMTVEGPPGPVGPQGVSGKDLSAELEALEARVSELERRLTEK